MANYPDPPLPVRAPKTTRHHVWEAIGAVAVVAGVLCWIAGIMAAASGGGSGALYDMFVPGWGLFLGGNAARSLGGTPKWMPPPPRPEDKTDQ